jgi:PAS domain-containing protein
MVDKINYQIIDALNASVYWKDINGKYLGCNDYMAKMAGLSREQIIGNTDYYLPWKDRANKIREIDLLVINNCKKYEIEETALTSDYLTRVFLSSIMNMSEILEENWNVLGSVDN